MDTDNETAKIAAQELDREASKECSSETGVAGATDSGKFGGENPESFIVHTDQKISDEQLDAEAAATPDVTPPPVKVPRSERRGLLGRFALLAEITEPKHYPRSTKWWITFIVASAAIAAPMGSAIILRKTWLPPSNFHQLTKESSVSR